jgi:hypothetical protein
MDKETVWQLPDGPISIQFEDGVLETTARATIFSWYCAVFHRHFPETPLLKHHHLGNERLSKSSHLNLLGKGYFDTLETYYAKGKEVDTEFMQLLVFQTTNEIYNDFTYRLERYVTTISILDFVDIVTHPVVEEANDTVKPSQVSIDSTYKTIKNALLDSNNFRGNGVAEAAKSGLVSMGQVLQCVGPRGYLTDIDSNIFRQPILQGYVHGIRSLYDSMIESRSASKAQYFAKDPVADSEYFNRKMQLQTAVISRLHRVDCGSTETIPFRVRSTDLESLEGKFYYTETGDLVAVSEGDRHLIGKTINMRSVLKCKHPDPNGVCLVCMGELGYSVPDQTILGHVAATVLCEIISQNVLSTKHLDGSSTVDMIKLGAYEENYVQVGSDPNTIKLNPDLEGKKVTMVLSADESERLSDIMTIQNISRLTPSKVTELREVEFIIEGEDETEHVVIPVSMGSRLSSLTVEALTYVKYMGWTLTAKGDCAIDLSNWDIDQPLFEMPLKHTNMVDFMKEIETFIKSSKKTKGTRHQKNLNDYDTVEDGLLALYTLVSSKLKVNIAHIELIVLATLSRDPKHYDHRLPVPKSTGVVSGYEDNMVLRSNSVAMAYQNQGSTLYDLRSYMIDDRPDHYMDNILMGNQTK